MITRVVNLVFASALALLGLPGLLPGKDWRLGPFATGLVALCWLVGAIRLFRRKRDGAAMSALALVTIGCFSIYVMVRAATFTVGDPTQGVGKLAFVAFGFLGLIFSCFMIFALSQQWRHHAHATKAQSGRGEPPPATVSAKPF